MKSLLPLSLMMAFCFGLGHSVALAEAPRCTEVFALSDYEQRQHFGELKNKFYYTGDRTTNLAFDVFKNFKKGFRDPDFYEVFKDRNDDVRMLFKNWYPEDATDLDIVLRRMGPKLFPLILDPGIRYRLQDFLQVLENLPRSLPHTPIAVREYYSDYLGYITVYRGMRLEKETLPGLKATGFPSRNFYNPKALSGNSVYDFGRFFHKGPNGDIELRLEGAGQRSMSQSFTGIRILAEGFAINNKTEHELSGSTQAAILLTAEVPVLDLIEHRMLSSVGFVGRHGWKLSHFKANDKWVWGGSQGLEYFLIGPMDPRWIVDVSEVTSGSGLGPQKFLGISH